MAEPQATYERRQGMRARGGWVWSTWQPCTEAEARRVTGLHSWQVRQYGLCAACAGTGRAPLGVTACPECGRGEVIDGKCDRCRFVVPAPARPLAALKEAEQRTRGVPGTPVADLQPDQMRRCCDGEVRLGAKCGRCGLIATVEHNLPATPGVTPCDGGQKA